MTNPRGYNYQCPACDEGYLPLEAEQRACPRCGEIAPEGAPSIPEIVECAREIMGKVRGTKTTVNISQQDTGDLYLCQAIWIMVRAKASAT